jgi:hypothetical protein
MSDARTGFRLLISGDNRPAKIMIDRQLIVSLSELLENSNGLSYFSQLLQSEGEEWYVADQHFVSEFQRWTRSVETCLRLSNADDYLEIWQKETESEVIVSNVYDYHKRIQIILKQIIATITSKFNFAPDLAQVNNTPFLTDEDILNAGKMAELYLILHCYENSVRRFIHTIMSSELGDGWWEVVATDAMKNTVKSRMEKEEKQKWLSARGSTSPLYYLEWGDLVKLIRKKESAFLPHIGSLKFIENRFEELEALRNIVAHNGVLPSKDDFDRVILSFRDWCRQINNI